LSTTTYQPGDRRDRFSLHTTRNFELTLLAAAALVVIAAVWHVRVAKQPLLDETRAGLASGRILHLSSPLSPGQLRPALKALRHQPESDLLLAENTLSRWLATQPKPLPNVGRLASLRVSASDLARFPRSEHYHRQLDSARQRLEAREADRSLFVRWFRSLTADPPQASVRLLSSATLADAKPFFIVRTPGDFSHLLRRTILLFFVPFFLAHAAFRLRGFHGDPYILPALLLLTGFGFAYLISLRDPVRDTTQWEDFAWGVGTGILVMAGLALLDVARQARGYFALPLALSAGLFAALFLFGTGPTGSGVRINLLGTQPIELIKVLLAFFLAGYLASEWEKLRYLGDAAANWFSLPRRRDIAPILACLAMSLLFLFACGDLGPALVLCLTFLAIYCVTRRSATPAILLIGAIAAILWLVHQLRFPEYVAGRVDMWLDPWRVYLGKSMQLANSLWALASGGVWGAGFGFGMPEAIEAAHTDMVLAGIGEELGFAGLAGLFALYCVLFWRFFRIAQRSNVYGFYLATTLTLLLGVQLLLIAAGTLGLLPLSGVVAPFLSYGRSSMLVNLAACGVILSLSQRPSDQLRVEFGRQLRTLATVFGALAAIVLARAAWIQLYQADERMARTVALQQWTADDPDERSRLTGQFGEEFRQLPNPRLTRMALLIPRGTIFDRNGLPIASSDRAAVAQHKDTYEKLGLPPAQLDRDINGRYYPFGVEAYYLVDDARQMSELTLRGYGRLSELVPLWRHRADRNVPLVREILDRNRDLKLTIDMGVQLAASRALAKAGQKKAAAAVVDPATGDILALASRPLPPVLPGDPDLPGATAQAGANLARTGLYPPGSAFKLVTAMAALRKNPDLARARHDCERIEPTRVGKIFRFQNQRYTIRDFPGDPAHGALDMKEALVVSCNAYFAQLAAFEVGAEPLRQTAGLFQISVDNPERGESLEVELPRAGYGQGEVVVTPLQMARVASAIANGGQLAPSRFIAGATEPAPARIIDPGAADYLKSAMRDVVRRGTAAPARIPAALEVAGKTGTAQWKRKATDHAWFTGFAPSAKGQIAFAVVVVEGGGGGRTAAPIAGQIVAAVK